MAVFVLVFADSGEARGRDLQGIAPAVGSLFAGRGLLMPSRGQQAAAGGVRRLLPLDSPLTCTGIDFSDGVATVGAGDRIQVPRMDIISDETVAWFAFSVRPAFASDTAADSYVFEWADDANNRVFIFWDDATLTYRLQRRNATSANTASATQITFAAGDSHVVIGQLELAAIRIDITGGAVVSNTAAQNIPTLAATTADIGSSGGSVLWNGAFRWAAFGRGTPGASDRTVLKEAVKSPPNLNLLSSDVKLTGFWHPLTMGQSFRRVA